MPANILGVCEEVFGAVLDASARVVIGVLGWDSVSAVLYTLSGDVIGPGAIGATVDAAIVSSWGDGAGANASVGGIICKGIG